MLRFSSSPRPAAVAVAEARVPRALRPDPGVLLRLVGPVRRGHAPDGQTAVHGHQYWPRSDGLHVVGAKYGY